MTRPLRVMQCLTRPHPYCRNIYYGSLTFDPFEMEDGWRESEKYGQPGSDCLVDIQKQYPPQYHLSDILIENGMKPKIYLETSIISYLASRPSRDLVVAAHQQITV